MAEHWLAGRLAVVTGASRGIGAATARAIADAGAHVVLAARDGEALEPVAGRIRDAGRRGHAGPDGRELASSRSSASLPAPTTAGTIAALVCAAGVLTPAPFVANDPGGLGADAGGQSDRLIPLLSRCVRRDAGRRRRTDRQHRVAFRCLRDREVPRPERLQRLQVRGHRSDGGDRGGGQGARDQRDLRQSWRGRHPDAARSQSRPSSRPHTRLR